MILRMTVMPRPLRRVLPGSVLAALALTGCGGTAAGEKGVTGAAGTEDTGGLSVVAAFYPLEFLAAGVGGDRVTVTGLTPPGAEPHDLELSPQSLASLTDADLAVVLSDFQPAVDDAVAGTSVEVLDLAELADRLPGAAEGDHADEHAAEDGHTEEQEHAHGGTDPHFWTDPTNMAEAAELVADAFTEADPDGADVYAANAEELVAELTTLDEEARTTLGSCEIDTLVTAHDAFGYFGDRYGFDVRPINGLTPEQEPDARTLGEISDFVVDSGITTVYTETLVPTAIADTVAAEAGVRTAVLDPLEGLTDDSAGSDYLEIMRANIATVRDGQSCA